MRLLESYRQYAAECLRIAANSTDQHNKASLKAMAIAWNDLAERAERREEKANGKPKNA
jgi:hypothetical protein